MLRSKGQHLSRFLFLQESGVTAPSGFTGRCDGMGWLGMVFPETCLINFHILYNMLVILRSSKPFISLSIGHITIMDHYEPMNHHYHITASIIVHWFSLITAAIRFVLQLVGFYWYIIVHYHYYIVPSWSDKNVSNQQLSRWTICMMVTKQHHFTFFLVGNKNQCHFPNCDALASIWWYQHNATNRLLSLITIVVIPLLITISHYHQP